MKVQLIFEGNTASFVATAETPEDERMLGVLSPGYRHTLEAFITTTDARGLYPMSTVDVSTLAVTVKKATAPEVKP